MKRDGMAVQQRQDEEPAGCVSDLDFGYLLLQMVTAYTDLKHAECLRLNIR